MGVKTMQIKGLSADVYKCNPDRERQNVTRANGTQKYYFNDASQLQQVISQKRIDTIELSDEALRILEQKRNEVSELNSASREEAMLDYDFQVAQKQAEDEADAWKDELIALEIMRRISSGDIVPASDERKLMEYDAELYQMAKMTGMMRRKNERKEYDTLLEEESNEGVENEPVMSEPDTYGVSVEMTVSDDAVPSEIPEVPVSE